MNFGTWTKPLAKICDPTETGNNKIALKIIKVIHPLNHQVSVFAQCVMCSVCVLLPFFHVMAGFGAPLVWQINKAVFPSVTVWSDGGNVNVGATPETKERT